MSEAFVELGDAIHDQRFVEVDLALRRGQHIDRDDADLYAYLLDARNVLEPFYNRYSCELVHRTDGYFFLLPLGEKVPRRLLGIPEMIVGQAAALLYLDPSTIERGGVLTKDDILSHLAAIMGTDALVAAFNPKRKRMDERVAQETVRQRTGEALRKLAQLGFVSQLEDGQLRLRSALMRFADPVRGAGSPREALEKLIARGEIAIPEDVTPEDSANDDSANDAFEREDDGPSHYAVEANSDDGIGDEPTELAADDDDEPTEFDSTPPNDPQTDLADFSYDSEFPLEPQGQQDDSDDDLLGDDVERSDAGDVLDHDADAAVSENLSSGKSTQGKPATTQSAEWDPTFDDFD